MAQQPTSFDPPSASPSVARLAAAYRYLYYSDRIEGWMHQTSALAMMELLWLQEETGLTGDIAEIGVHHGCSALALVAAARPNETVVAIDLFDRQDLNFDGSGGGSLSAFQEHLQYLFPRAKVRIIAKSSTDIRGAEREYGLAGIRFFSLDGGHTTALTINDLEIADASLASHGVAVLDDVFNDNWPGVASGLFAFLARRPDLVPFAIFPNKTFLCRGGSAAFYRKGCRDLLGFALHKKDMEFYDRGVDVYEDVWPHLTRRLANAAVTAAVEADLRAIDNSDRPIARHLIARPGDWQDPLAHLRYMQDLLARERRRGEILENKVEGERLEAQEAMKQLAALRSSTSWRVTAPLRWIGSLVRGFRH